MFWAPGGEISGTSASSAVGGAAKYFQSISLAISSLVQMHRGSRCTKICTIHPYRSWDRNFNAVQVRCRGSINRQCEGDRKEHIQLPSSVAARSGDSRCETAGDAVARVGVHPWIPTVIAFEFAVSCCTPFYTPCRLLGKVCISVAFVKARSMTLCCKPFRKV